MKGSSLGHIDVISSGSSGNCLVLYDSKGYYLIIDVGVTWDKIAKGINYELCKCNAILASHRHRDHVKSLSKFIDLGISCYGNEDICSRYKGCNLITDTLQIGNFKVSTFPVGHDVPNNAFVIDTQDNVRVLYLTDAKELCFDVENVNCAIIEANWDADTMFDNAMNGIMTESQFNNHQSLDACISFLKKANNPSLHTVVLWHLSSTNINAEVAKERVQQEVGIQNVIVAKAGITIELTNK